MRGIEAVFLAHVAATLFMTGLIWFVQVVHYPLFEQVGAGSFASYENGHTARTTLVVAPAMLVEAATAALLLLMPPAGAPRWALWVGAGLVAVNWLSTAMLQVPQHNVLGLGFDREAHDLLVRTNWVRTVAWSLRAMLVLWLAAKFLAGPEGLTCTGLSSSEEASAAFMPRRH
ncbi:MAG: hypothetical protein SFV54_04460 [Bryobacteraceae bacterium]|nr:hypothetical protein [Bryobacteraceae bacterium]